MPLGPGLDQERRWLVEDEIIDVSLPRPAFSNAWRIAIGTLVGTKLAILFWPSLNNGNTAAAWPRRSGFPAGAMTGGHFIQNVASLCSARSQRVTGNIRRRGSAGPPRSHRHEQGRGTRGEVEQVEMYSLHTTSTFSALP